MTALPASRRDARLPWAALVLLWLAGNALRLTILAIPPVVAAIRDEFGLSATEVGLLGSVAPALFAVAAVAGSLVIARLGVRAALIGGMAVVAIGSALRGLSGNYPVLLSTTILMCIGVAIMQPAMPSAVRLWAPGRIALATAVYTNGLLFGEVFPVMLAAPVVLPAVHGSWRASLVVWSAVVAFIVVAAYLLTPRRLSSRVAHGAPGKWLPDWRKGLVWRIGIVLGCVNTIYFATNTYLPIYLASAGRHDLIAGALTALNVGQLPASVVVLVMARRLERRAWPYWASGACSLVAVAGLLFQVGAATSAWAALLGFSDAVALILALTLPAMLCDPEDVGRTAAGAFTISYGTALVVTVIGGALWDSAGRAVLAFLPIAACAGALIVIQRRMQIRHELV